jgi:hypothetical protein
MASTMGLRGALGLPVLAPLPVVVVAGGLEAFPGSAGLSEDPGGEGEAATDDGEGHGGDDEVGAEFGPKGEATAPLQ